MVETEENSQQDEDDNSRIAEEKASKETLEEEDEEDEENGQCSADDDEQEDSLGPPRHVSGRECNAPCSAFSLHSELIQATELSLSLSHTYIIYIIRKKVTKRKRARCSQKRCVLGGRPVFRHFTSVWWHFVVAISVMVDRDLLSCGGCC